MDTKAKEGSFMTIFLFMIVSLIIAFLWDAGGFIKNYANAVLNPTVGTLLNLNITWGMIAIVFVLSIFTTLIQKYMTDQKALREIKEEQKRLNEEAKKFSHDPKKMMEFNKKIIPMSMQIFKLSMRPIAYTSIPLILFFRWFLDYFNALGSFKFFGFFSWFWFYPIGTIIFSSVLRKILKVV